MQIVVDIFLILVYCSIFLLLCIYTWRFWIMYVQQKAFSNMNNSMILLEIKLPREVFKSPQAMEIVLNSFLQSGGVAQWYKRNWLGALVTFFSLEIASIEGEVRFFVRGEKKFRQILINNFYSQYPGIEISEADDYVTKIFYDHRQKDVAIWGIENTLSESFSLPATKAERKEIIKKASAEKNEKKKKEILDKLKVPADYKMIKTYIDYAQDKDPKEEYEHDPLTPILEWMGSMRKGEYAWYQFILQDQGKFDGETFGKTYECKGTHEEFTLSELAKERRTQLRTKIPDAKYKKGDIVYDDYGYAKTRSVKTIVKDEEGKDVVKVTEENMTYQNDDPVTIEHIKESELNFENKKEIEMISRKLEKPLLRGLIRVMYLAESDKQNTGENVQSLLTMFKQYTAPGFNGFKPKVSDPYDYSWEDDGKKRKPWRNEEMFESYIEREAFYPHLPDRKKSMGGWIDWFTDGKGIDRYADVYLFKKSLGFRKKLRLMYEAFVHPLEHQSPSLSTYNLEEVASLWHLPGSVATTPGIKRIDSLKSDAPGNLPR